MPGADELQHQLESAQNADGGWPFRQGSSWVEPTSLALLALQSAAHPGTACRSALSWISRQQNQDGGLRPGGGLNIGTWVTSLAALAMPQTGTSAAPWRAAISWVASQVYPEPTGLQLILARVLGTPPSQAPGSSPWFPGTAGWVIPTAISILALSQAAQIMQDGKLKLLARRAQTYLLARRCSDGGWNHGGSSFRSENAVSYPETTGIALLALSNVPSTELGPAIPLARSFLRRPDSVEGRAWLQLGLLAHGIDAASGEAELRPRSTREISLTLLALAAARGINPFLCRRPALCAI